MQLGGECAWRDADLESLWKQLCGNVDLENLSVVVKLLLIVAALDLR
jgi:hypothetical protein